MRIAVTGASGFVGGAVCRALTGAGHDVVGFGRRPTTPPGHVGAAAYRQWDLTGGPLPDPPPVDAVVHCAGTVTDWGPRREFFAVNVDGTRHALAAWPRVRFVHVSTASVYDPRRPTVMATEDQAPAGRYLNAYGASKAAAERVVLAADRPAIVLRPHAVYGPGDTTLLPRVLAAVRGGRLPAVGDGRQPISLTSVGNLVQACTLAACGPVERGVFNVTDACAVRLDDALRAILAERGIAARPVYLPFGAVWPLATAAEGLYRLFRSASPPRLTRYAISHLAVERTLDITAARRTLGYRPEPTSFAGAAYW
ncbi:NAD-dependent epimerase/dehydratase family protein [Catellatospora citrea]|uniref:NAD-dependent epimerase n=1 Tax=Catellatospora citrea TaxID=53366 RepID=A0A8J3K3F1_9ACTN|nr:NAD-dependent epimerase/dehydratase family protein [Catellatospora citrea]RKE12892.1 nucleoside-diphosphate-sugar epimerase [Catellatospora citrea]GIF95867.1 NAD-dependent epimerase [Catellatospora citrea]